MASTIVITNQLPYKIIRKEKSFSCEIVKKSNLSCVNHTPSWFHNLPIEVLFLIFKYFNQRELMTNLIPVCRHWRYVGSQPELWKSLHLQGNKIPTHFIYRKIRDFPYLEFIYLKSIAEPVSAIRQICRWLPRLRSLTLKDCPLISETALCNLIQCCKDLEALNLNGTNFKATRFFEELAGIKTLKSINVSNNPKLTLENVFSIVLNCRLLEELKICTFCPENLEKLRDNDISLILQTLRDTITSLTLDAGALTNFSFKMIMNCKHLKKLGLYRAINLGPEIFTNIWRYLPKLTVLKIRHAHHITGENVYELFNNGKHVLKQLIVIDFSGCWQINDKAIQEMAKCCKDLKTLTLKSCKSITTLEEVRNECVKLEKLNIAFCENLNTQTIIPLPNNLRILIADKNEHILANIKNERLQYKLNFKICLSEYNRRKENIMVYN